MKSFIKILFLVVFCLILGLSEYLQLKKFTAIQEQLNTVNQVQRNMLADLKAIRLQQDLAQRQGPKENPIDFDKEYQIDIGNSSVKGNKNAQVTLVEFSDFQCPYSQMFHPIVGQALNAYPDKVKYMLKNYPLPYHPQAKPAAMATFAAREQGKYWEMVEEVFKEGKNLSEEKFQELAQRIGLNVKKFTKDLQEKAAQWEKLLQEDMAAAGKAAVRGTPMFFVNGKLLKGRSLEDFKAAIDEILKEKPQKK